MAYDSDSGEKQSKFNAGVAFAERIHDLQLAINVASFNPLAKNPNTGTYNYEVMFECLNRLVKEGWDKFNDGEREDMERMRVISMKMNKYFPAITFDKNGGARLNKDNYEKLMQLFHTYELKQKEFYGNHDINSPSKGWDDDEGY